MNTLEDMQIELTKAVWKDESLREEIMKNPREAVEKILGVKFKEDVTVSAVDQTQENVVTFVLPPHPAETHEVEFTDEQLDAIAGGVGGSYDLYVGANTIEIATITYVPSQG
jgi:hypothetical protein